MIELLTPHHKKRSITSFGVLFGTQTQTKSKLHLPHVDVASRKKRGTSISCRAICMMHASQPPFRVACPMTPHLRIDDNSARCMSTTHQWSTKGSFDINCGTFAHAHHHVVVNVSHSCLFVCVNATYPALQMRTQLLLTCPSAQRPTTLFVMLALCPTQHPVTARSLSCVPMQQPVPMSLSWPSR